MIEILRGDCLQVLPTRTERFPVVILDPPFNVGLDYDGYEDRREDGEYWEWLRTILQILYQVMAEHATLYCFQSDRGIYRLKEEAEKCGFLWKQKLWWLIPALMVLLLFGLLLLFAQSTPLAPFVYTLF